MSARPVLLDTDPGIDDALALEYLLALGTLDLKAMTVVAGNVPLPVGLKNALGLATLLEIERDVPVYAGCPKPLLRPLHTAERVHGEGGTGGATLPEATVQQREGHAARAICDLARRYEGELTVLAIGPLTNVAAALVLDPDLPRRVKELVFMGGAMNLPGNAPPGTAEFNVFVDPEAARMVLGSGIPYTVVGLDATNQGILTREEATLLDVDAPPLRFAATALGFYLDAYEKARGRAACALHDPLAVAVAEDPGWARLEEGRVYVETAGELTSGETLFVDEAKFARWSGEGLEDLPTGRVATGLGREGFARHFVETLVGRYGSGVPEQEEVVRGG